MRPRRCRCLVRSNAPVPEQTSAPATMACRRKESDHASYLKSTKSGVALRWAQPEPFADEKMPRRTAFGQTQCCSKLMRKSTSRQFQDVFLRSATAAYTRQQRCAHANG